MNILRTLFLNLLLLSSLGIYAQDFGLGSGLSFLLVNPDARSSSMGGFGVSNSNSANAIFNNFSLVPMLNKKASVDISVLPSKTTISGRVLSASGFIKLKNNHAVGISARRARYGVINFTDINGNSTGSGRPLDYELSAAYGLNISSNVSLGVRAKYIYSNRATGQQFLGLDIISGKSFAADFSLNYHSRINANNDRLIVGLTAENIGTKISYVDGYEGDKLPQSFAIAASYQKYISNSFHTLISIVYENQFDELALFSPRWSIGNELTYNDMISLRFGYENYKATSFLQDMILIGVGLQTKLVSIQAAYHINPKLRVSPMGDHLRMNLIFHF